MRQYQLLAMDLVINATISRPDAVGSGNWYGQGRPDWGRDFVGVRSPDAIRPGGWFSVADYQEAASKIDHS
jgi:hypothetical protein